MKVQQLTDTLRWLVVERDRLRDRGASWAELERNRLAMESELAPNVRLSCQIHVNGDLKVRVINQVSVRGMDAGPRPLDE